MPGKRVKNKSRLSLTKSIRKSLKRKSPKKSLKRKSAKKSLKRKSPKKSLKRKSQKGGLNKFFELMLNAKKNNDREFNYNGNTYKQMTTKTGMTVYKKK